MNIVALVAGAILGFVGTTAVLNLATRLLESGRKPAAVLVIAAFLAVVGLLIAILLG